MFKGKITCAPYTCGLNGDGSFLVTCYYVLIRKVCKKVCNIPVYFPILCVPPTFTSVHHFDTIRPQKYQLIYVYINKLYKQYNLFILIRRVVSMKLPDHHRGQWAVPSPCGSEWVYSAAACHQSTSRDSNAPRGLAAHMHHWQTEPCPLHSWTKQLTGLPEGPACRSVGEERTDLQNVQMIKRVSKIPPKPIWVFRWTKIKKSKAHRKQKQSIHPQLPKYSSTQSDPVNTTS